MSNTEQMNKQYYIYIMTNKTNRVLYTGVTNDLKRRVYEHKKKLVEGLTKKYNIRKNAGNSRFGFSFGLA